MEAELKDFYNEGFGWICRQCDAEDARKLTAGNEKHSRIFREGEAETKNPDLSTRALAKWTDRTRRFLMCPRCGITESVEVH